MSGGNFHNDPRRAAEAGHKSGGTHPLRFASHQ